MPIHLRNRNRLPGLARLRDINPQLKLKVKLLRRPQGRRPITLVLTVDEACEAADWGAGDHDTARVAVVPGGHVVEGGAFLEGGVDHVLDLGGVSGW